jgi:maleylacetate reductase
VVFGAMDEVVFGNRRPQRPSSPGWTAWRAPRLPDGQRHAEPQTDEIDKIRAALGARCIGTFDAMPAHTPRAGVIAASEQARAAGADLIVTVGGGSITDGAKAVQICLANDVAASRISTGSAPQGGASRHETPVRAPESACPPRLPAASSAPSPVVTNERQQGQGATQPSPGNAALRRSSIPR